MSAIQMTVILASIIDFGYAMLSVYEQIVFGKLFDFQMIIQKPWAFIGKLEAIENILEDANKDIELENIIDKVVIL